MLRDPDGREKRAIERILGTSTVDTLEVGCGDGRLTRILSGMPGAMYALDPDPVTIENARDVLGDEVRFIIGSGERLPFPDSRFDTVVFSLSLHHQDPYKALSETQRIMRNHGRVLILEPEGESLINRLFRIIHNEDEMYRKVQAAVSAGNLSVMDQGFYRTTWHFKDFEEMVNHLFGYFNLEPDRERTEEMAECLGDLCDLRPLDIEDVTRYWLLQKVRG
jgi:ubiquinone/menaquinone biosynthesis C-methylase UbiE